MIASETDRLLNFGVLGIVVILFITGWIVTGTQYKRLDQKHEELQQVFHETVIPLLERTTHALENNTEVMKQLLPPKDESQTGPLPEHKKRRP